MSGDTNNVGDVFVHDRQTGETTRVSVASDGTEGNFGSLIPSISADGRYVAFQSGASNLGGNNQFEGVFVHDRQTGQTTCISVAPDGTPENDVSGGPSISADGRYVAFHSNASNLVSGDDDDPNDDFGLGWRHDGDVFVHDRQTGQTSRISTAFDDIEVMMRGAGAPSISADGRYVMFTASQPFGMPGSVFVYDRQTGETTRVVESFDGTPVNEPAGGSSISANGRYVVFGSNSNNLVSGDTNNMWDIFVHDRQTTTGGFDYFMHDDPAHPGASHDADKTGNNDSNKCHAAATSNILGWGGWTVPPAYSTEQQMFSLYQTNWADKGSLVKYTSRWWLDGTNPPPFGSDWATVLTPGGGYFPTGTAQSNFAGAYLSHWTQATLLEKVKEYLHNGYGTTIALYDATDSDGLGHVLSVWGYRYDNNGKVLGLWVTDSDDASAEPPQEWLLPVKYDKGSGTELKWRVPAASPRYAGWLIEGVEALKPRTATTPAQELPRLAIVRKKCVDNMTGAEITCPANDNVTVYIGNQVCDAECKRSTVAFDNTTAVKLQALIDFDPLNPVSFKGFEVNGQMWTGGPFTAGDDLYVRPVIGCSHH